MHTRRNNNVIMTSKRRRDVILTPQWRHYCVVCPLGEYTGPIAGSKLYLDQPTTQAMAPGPPFTNMDQL